MAKSQVCICRGFIQDFLQGDNRTAVSDFRSVQGEKQVHTSPISLCNVHQVHFIPFPFISPHFTYLNGTILGGGDIPWSPLFCS